MDRQGSLLQLTNKQTANYLEPNLEYLKTFEVGDTVETTGVLYGIESSDRGPSSVYFKGWRLEDYKWEFM